MTFCSTPLTITSSDFSGLLCVGHTLSGVESFGLWTCLFTSATVLYLSSWPGTYSQRGQCPSCLKCHLCIRPEHSQAHIYDCSYCLVHWAIMFLTLSCHLLPLIRLNWRNQSSGNHWYFAEVELKWDTSISHIGIYNATALITLPDSLGLRPDLPFFPTIFSPLVKMITD